MRTSTFPSRNNKRDKLIVNADGSVDLYFGPKAPAGKVSELDRNRSRQVLVHTPAAVWPPRSLVQKDLAARRDRRGKVVAKRATDWTFSFQTAS